MKRYTAFLLRNTYSVLCNAMQGLKDIGVNQAVKIVVGTLAILGCYYLGVLIKHSTSLPLPAPLIGLLLLLVLLFISPRIEHAVALSSAPLLKHMTLFFVPAVLGVSLYWSDIQEHLFSLTLAIVGITALCLGITAWAASKILRNQSLRSVKSTGQGEQGND